MKVILTVDNLLLRNQYCWCPIISSVYGVDFESRNLINFVRSKIIFLINYLLIFPLTYLRTYLLNYLLTYTHTAWSMVVFENEIGFQLFKHLPAFYKYRKFVAVVTSVRHLYLPWARLMQPMFPKTISWKSILILFCHRLLVFPSGFLHTVCFPKLCIGLSSTS
jgi:hypothetical protein